MMPLTLTLLFSALAWAEPESPSAVDRFFSACVGQLELEPAEHDYRVRIFGRNERMAAVLVGLIRAGEKTATFSSPWLYEIDDSLRPVDGGYTVVTDFSGRPALLIRTTEVYTKAFRAISEGDSQYEGPGARPLEAWRRIHWDYFADMLAPSGREPAETMPVTVERFEVVCDAEN